MFNWKKIDHQGPHVCPDYAHIGWEKALKKEKSSVYDQILDNFEVMWELTKSYNI